MAPPAFTLDSRRQNLHRLREEPLDVLILGGGINGAGIARDLALRARRARLNLRIGLVEQRHFASGASGKNSHLIHGGLRYLKQLQIRLVRESLRERAILRAMAPHLVEPLPFLMPFYGRLPRLFYGAGLWMYDLLAGKHNIGRRRFLGYDEVIRLEPRLAREGLDSAAIFHDCRVQASRLVLENIFDAARAGAVVANYTRAEGISGTGATVVDVLSGESFPVRTRKVVDARGPWEDSANLRLVRGSHILLPRLNDSPNAIAYFGESGRIIFVIPWSERLSLVGTTDCDHSGSADDVHITAEEVDYLLGMARRLFPSMKDAEPVSAFSSLRPLLRGGAESASETSREHRIWNSSDGVLHVAGGKYTTYRLMSEQAADLVAREIAPQLVGQCVTAQVPLEGRPPLAPAGDPQQIAVAVHQEMARRLADLLFVCTYWGYERRWSADALRPIASEMGRHLGWSPERIEQETLSAFSHCGFPAIPALAVLYSTQPRPDG